MTTSEQSGILARLRRYQQLLVVGGGLAITIVVLVAGLLEIAASIDAYMARTKEEIAIDVRRSMDFSTRATATLRNNVQNVELAWDAASSSPAGRAAPFADGARVLRVQPNDDVPPLLVMETGDGAAPPDAWRYVQLAETMAAATVVVAARNAGDLAVYLISPDRRLLIMAVLPWEGAGWQERVVSDRAGLMAALAPAGVSPISAPAGGWRDPVTGAARLRWLPPYKSPLTGKESVRIATELRGRDGRPFGMLVYELPLGALAATLPSTSFAGTCMVLGPDNAWILSCQPSPDPALVPLARQAVAAGLGASARSAYVDGHVLSGWPLGPEGWTLVHAQSWRDIIAGVRPQIVLSILTSALIIALTWVLLLTVRRRVFIPAVQQSQRVFESEQLSRTLIETAPVGLGLIAVDSGHSLLRSPVMEDVAQRVVSDGPSLSHVLCGHYLQRENEAGRPGRAMAVQDDLDFSTRDGERLDLAVSMARARYRGEDVLVAAFTDVTAKRSLERELREARRAADAANAAKSAFLAMMSHEIRTPLNAILGNLEILEHAPLDALSRDRLQIVRRASDGLLAVVSDVLDFSKIEAGELQVEALDMDALDVASHALMMFAPVARAKGLTLVAELGAAIRQPMRADPARMGQVIQNLLSNAIKFTDSGQVVLRLRRDELGSPLEIEVEDTGIGMSSDQVAGLFRDFGQADASIGRRFGGTGLGLALSRRLAQAMGGTLVACSEPGRGSRFTLRLPLGGNPGATLEVPRFDQERVLLVAAVETWRIAAARVFQAWALRVETYAHPALIDTREIEDADVLVFWGDRQTWHPEDENRLVEDALWVLDCTENGPSEPVAAGRRLCVSVYGLRGVAAALRHALQGEHLPVARQSGRMLAKPLRVLVAEDNAVNRRLFEEQLGMLGCEVTAVMSAEQALARLEPGAFDVLLTDLSMPGMDGYALARRAVERCPGLPVLAATANVTPQERERGLRAGMSQVLGKPLSLGQLAQALSEATGLPVAQRDREAVDGLLGGHEVSGEAKQMFLRSCEAAVPLLRRGLQDDSASSVLAELHSLGGACGVFRLYSVAEQCAALEHAIKTDGLRARAADIHALCDTLSAVVAREPESLRNVADQIVALSESGHGEAALAEIAALAKDLQKGLRSGSGPR